eukprot:TRINITY_DN52383_c0_g1_i1.p1 TRINITY_DN52383_c0_g1~~TRINITY_DN52383_c0_g1_i1.p1  ORF type:complete len:167 (+),score=44.25 TRINITY_DN52383_c0_g1_i1:344-844(+)
MNHLSRLGAAAGYDFNFNVRATNTFKSHRVLLWAESRGLGVEFGKALARRYFEEGRALGDDSTLLDAAEEVGLPKDDTEKILASDQMADVVRKKYAAAMNSGIHSIPLFLLAKDDGSNAEGSSVLDCNSSSDLKLPEAAVSVHGSATPEEFEAAMRRLALAQQSEL